MITTRFIGADDIAAAEEFLNVYDANYDWRVDLNRDEFLDAVSDDAEYYIGAFDDDEIVGVISLGGADGVIDEAADDDALLSDLYVIPQARNAGIGGMLVARGLSEAKDQGYLGMYACILDDNLVQYYRRFGFTQVYPGLLYREL